MFLLRTLFRARSGMQMRHAAEEPVQEMTFLEHLEDLRRTIIRMSLTVLVAMMACFAFATQMLDVLRLPVEAVWRAHESNHLPASVEVADWMAAKDLEGARRALEPAAREQLETHFSAEVRALADALPLLRAAAALPKTAREPYLQQVQTSEQVRTLALQLHESGADLDDGHSGAEPRIMGAFQPGEAFMLSLQLAFFGGLIVSSPLLLYFMLQFIMPGLLKHERRVILASVWWGVGLFLLGCGFAYYAVLPRVLAFFFEYSWSMGIANDWRIGYYLTFASKLIFVFGLIFELPVVVIPLIKLEILTYTRMRRTRPYAIVGCFAAALFLAPAPDPGTMFIMALPLYFLYELCILIAWRDARRREAQMDASA